MSAFRINLKIDQKGAVFSASKTKAAGARAVIEINEAIAQEGVRRVKARLGQVLQNPTGFYESRITVDRRSIYRGISDSNVIYGGWLEGVSSRNRSTRFKGYRTFRMVKQSLDKDSRALAQPMVNNYVQEMNR